MLVAENAEQTGGIFPTRHLKRAAVWIFPQSIYTPSRVWCANGGPAEAQAARQGPCVLRGDH